LKFGKLYLTTYLFHAANVVSPLNFKFPQFFDFEYSKARSRRTVTQGTKCCLSRSTNKCGWYAVTRERQMVAGMCDSMYSL